MKDWSKPDFRDPWSEPYWDFQNPNFKIFGPRRGVGRGSVYGSHHHIPFERYCPDRNQVISDEECCSCPQYDYWADNSYRQCSHEFEESQRAMHEADEKLQKKIEQSQREEEREMREAEELEKQRALTESRKRTRELKEREAWDRELRILEGEDLWEEEMEDDEDEEVDFF